MRNYDKYKKQNVYKKDDFSVYTFLTVEHDDCDDLTGRLS